MIHHTSNNPPFIVMDDGVWHLYSVTYGHNTTLFGIEFYARNDAEASAMVQSMRIRLNEPERVVDLFGGHMVREN
jgi:hypothetical protein